MKIDRLSRLIKTTHEANRLTLLSEFIILFVLIPVFLYLYPTRLAIPLFLWFIALYAYLTLKKDQVSWRLVWEGKGFQKKDMKWAALRFSLSIPLVILLTIFLLPSHLFTLPLEKPLFWLLIMALYPLLSVLPQELIFRSFFFRRYRKLISNQKTLLILSAVLFSFVHIVFHNAVAPLLCLLGGALFAQSYSQHRSLKWVLIEHAAYGCMIFTVGIGSFFVIGFRP